MTGGTGRCWPRIGEWALGRRSLSVVSLGILVLAIACGSAAATRWPGPKPVHVPAGLGMVSCASPTFCVAASVQQADVVTFDGQSWSGPQPIGGIAPATGLSCASNTFCLLVDGDGEVQRFDGTGWTSLSAQPAVDLSDISCVSAAFCLGSDASGETVSFHGSSWTQPQQSGATRIQCRAMTQCIGLTNSGVPVLYNGQSWRLVPVPHHWSTPAAVSCAAADLCEAVDNRGAFYAYTDGSWVPFGYGLSGGAGSYSLSCASETVCAFGLPRLGITTFAGVIDRGTNYFVWPSRQKVLRLAVSCIPTFCAAVDRSGLADAFSVSSSTGLPSGLPTAILNYEDAMFAATNLYPDIKAFAVSVTASTVTERGRCASATAADGLDQSYTQTAHSLMEVTCRGHARSRARRVPLSYLDTVLARYRNYKPLLTVLGDLAARVGGLDDPHANTTSAYATSSELVVQYAEGRHGYLHTVIIQRRRHRLSVHRWFY
jgi:hypothetical protein